MKASSGWSATGVAGWLAVLALLLTAPKFLPVYWIMIVSEIAVMGLFAMSFNLMLGYTGLLSFGQAGFFGVGAYTVALIFEAGGGSLILALGAAIVLAAAVSGVIGYLCVRRDEIFFAMITLGFGMMLYTIAHNWIDLTGGSDGLPIMLVPDLRLPGATFSLYDPTVMYYFVLAVCGLGCFFLRRVVRSPFGLLLTAIRENKERLSFVGGNVERTRLTAFVISGGLAGLAGGLFAMFSSMATPDFMHWTFSARPVMMTILGGAEVFFGPLVGAAIFFILEQITTTYTDNWMIVLGGILIPVVIFFPRGTLGTVTHWMARGKKERP